MRGRLDTELNADRIAPERRERIASRPQCLGALQVAAEVRTRFRVPKGGGRPTDPSWSQRRLIPLSPLTIERLSIIASQTHASSMQVAAILLEKAVQAAMENA